MTYNIFIIDDEIEICTSLSELLTEEGYNSSFCQDPCECISVIKSKKIDLIIMDVKMPKTNGIDLLKTIKNENQNVPIIMISGYASIENIVSSMKYGALNFYTKPIDNQKLLTEISLLAKTGHPDFTKKTNDRIVTKNANMQNIITKLEMAAPTDAAVIITGESGTGKELVADALHHLSHRKDKPFIKINCAAIPETLLESEMFGYEKGAFTDAKSTKKGKFEIAADGSIFLDEIGDMSLKIQAKMLRILQEKKFMRIGSSTEIQTNCRIITATNRNLEELINNGLFRKDLYYRLSVITISIPPLKERKEDVVPLANFFLNQFCNIYDKKIYSIADEVKTFLLQHDWPGNVRELKNFIERAVIFCKKEYIDFDSLPEQYNKFLTEINAETLDKRYEELSRNMILEALEQSKYVKYKAARMLNIDRKTLYNKMKKFNIG